MRLWRAGRARRILLVLAVVLLAVGLAGFLADALGLPDDVLALLDQRASVISMVIGLVGLIVQVRSSRRSPEPPSSPRVVGLPRPPARRFVGRERALRQLTAAPEGGAGVVSQAICGLGGIGKSELALQYAHAHRDDYELIWWITAENPGQVRSGLADLGRALAAATACRGQNGPAPMPPLADQDAHAYALAWLAGRGDWLLVFDNVEDPYELDPYLGRLERGHVLITSRRAIGWEAIGSLISLPVLSAREAMALLAGRIGSAGPDVAHLHSLADELGFLPLALVQAGGYIASTPGMSVAEYRRLLAAAPGRMHAASPAGESDDDRRAIAKVWQVTRDDLAARDPLTVDLLRLLACFAPDDLPTNVLGESVDVAEAVALLASYSMITLTRPEPARPGEAPEQPLVSMHRLVQAVIRAELDGAQRRLLRERAARLLDAALPADPERIASWPRCAQLLPHIRTLLAPDSAGTAKAIQYLVASGDPRTAHAWQLDRHAALHTTRGPDHPDTLAARHDLARYRGKAGDAVAARDELAALLPVQERVQGPGHPQVLATRHALTLWMGKAGDPAAARAGAAALLPIRERVLGAEHSDTLTTRHDLAYWTGQAGDPRSARDQLLALLPVSERVLGPEHPHVLGSRHVLAVLLGVLGDAVAAREQFAALARIRERVQGPEHPVTLNARHELARWAGEAGDANSARNQFAALLPVRERVQGPDHPDTLVARDALAYWERQAGLGDSPLTETERVPFRQWRRRAGR
ncbi:tetratricopeptide repeat-containing protein [Nonomuraea rosea]|uniref:tetratricopeptide repeat-containing protein n=1 Tax=Nonomuraea rosea TaxID=638574 RepID=UPI0031E8F012